MLKSGTNLKTKLLIAVDVAVFLGLIFLVPNWLLVLFFILLLYRIKWKADRIVVDGNELVIKNWFTTTSESVDLHKIENLAFNEELIGPRLLLMQDGRVVVKLRYRSYSNFSQLLEGLEERIHRRDAAAGERSS